MADAIYNSFKKEIMDGTLDLDTDTLYCLLVTSTYTPNIDTHSVRNDVTNEVANGNGYTTGGTEITSKAVTQDDTDDEGVFDGADVSWANSTITARGAVVYKSTGAITTDNLVCYFDFTADKSSNNGTFTVQWSTEGILNLTG